MKSTMNWRLKASLFCYIIFVLLSVPIALIYILRSEFMPYHAAAVMQNWSEVNPAFQNIILGLMKAVGAGWLSLSIATTILIVKAFKHNIRWAFWAIPVIALPIELINLYVSINMTMNTPATCPWQLVVFKSTLLLVGFILFITGKAQDLS